MSDDNNNPHSAYRVYQILKKKVLELTLPGLKSQKERSGIIAVLLIVAGILIGTFGALFVYENFISPPTQVFGICPPPSELTGAGCVKTITTTMNAQTTTIQVPGDYYYLYLNGSKYQG